MVDTAKIPAIELAVRTDPGRDPDKQVNEDSAVHADTPLGMLAVVCDGMGGHAGGKEASQLAIKTVEELVLAAPRGSVAKTVLRHAIEEANSRIWNMPTGEPGLRPGSTIVAMILSENGADIAHVGDSRIYLVHAGAVSQVTRDHSMVQEMVDRNLIKAEDAAKHPDANKILRALGIAKDVEVDVRAEPMPYVAGDVFILCSDGLSDLVGPTEILEIAGSNPPKQAAGQLVDLANARGGHDNITAMVIRMKASSVARDPATIVKTMQLTATDAPPLQAPADQGSGPTGTLVSPPIAPPQGPGTAIAPTLPSPHGPPGVVAPPSTSAQVVEAPPPPRGAAAIPIPPPRESIPPRSRLGIYLGIALAVVAIALVGGLIYVSQQEKRHEVKVIDDEKDAAVAPIDDEAGAAVEPPPVTATPPLAPQHDGGHPHHHHRDGGPRPTPSGAVTPSPSPSPSPTPPPPTTAVAPLGTEPAVCVKARQAKAEGRPAAIVTALESQCRNAGGVP